MIKPSQYLLVSKTSILLNQLSKDLIDRSSDCKLDLNQLNFEKYQTK